MLRYPASELHWDSLPDFSEHEFNHVDLTKIDERLILELQNFREKLGVAVMPSPNKGGWARESGSKTSRHYAIGRLCDAGDVFVDCDISHAFNVALQCKFGAVGVYVDTNYRGKPRPMLHLDMRAATTKKIWARYTLNGEPVYTSDSTKIHALMGAEK